MKILDLFKVREPVLSIVEEVLKDPSKHAFSLLSEHHICLYFRKERDWRITIAHYGLWVLTGENAQWMTGREARYVYKKLRPLYEDKAKTREGWLEKVNPEVK